MSEVHYDSALSKSCSSQIESSLKTGRSQVLDLTLEDGRHVTVSMSGLPDCISSAPLPSSANVVCNTGPAQLVFHAESQQWHLLWKVDIQAIRAQRLQEDYLKKVARMNAFLSQEIEKIADTFDWYEK